MAQFSAFLCSTQPKAEVPRAVRAGSTRRRFQRWMADTVFGLAYEEAGAEQAARGA